ncbi:Uu.00g057530.m01.CDS01 [Anthostomella pinea]|uniref:Uu.00g057530.m01.CDS01 n=1 Tax=Anthostomella pinea TaxID=933095 RepID=A0AAI8VSK5_9PEZI|nr:Uu.00g057530.m01.CDS01 [Anthostomella pinea]
MSTRQGWFSWTREWLLTKGTITSKTAVSRTFDQVSARILITGLDAAGKTTLLERHLSQDLGRDIGISNPATGFNVEELRYGKVDYEAIDVGGDCKKLIKDLERSKFHESDAVIWIIDSNDTERFVEAEEELQRMLRLDDDRHKPLLVLANKQDLKDCSEV